MFLREEEEGAGVFFFLGGRRYGRRYTHTNTQAKCVLKLITHTHASHHNILD